MDSAATRPLRLGCFDVRNGTVFAADESLPVAAEFDAATGETVRVFSWPLSRDHRGRPVALDILGRDENRAGGERGQRCKDYFDFHFLSSNVNSHFAVL